VSPELTAAVMAEAASGRLPDPLAAFSFSGGDAAPERPYIVAVRRGTAPRILEPHPTR